MFLNQPQPDWSIEESLLAGSRHTAVRVVDGVTYVTTIMIIRLDPVPPLYQVAHARFREPQPGKREYLVQQLTDYDDLTAALEAVYQAHHDVS